MGALTLGIVLPAGPSTSEASALRAQPANWPESPALETELRTALDLREAARSLGMSCEVVAVPACSDAHGIDFDQVCEILRRRLGSADMVVIAAHGCLGGSAKLHEAARACGLPVLGPSPEAIELAFDKLRSREHLHRNNLPVPRTIPVETAPAGAERLLGWPCVVKPRRGSGSADLHRLEDPAAITTELGRRRALSGGHPTLMEREFAGREVSVVVLDGEVLGVAEIERDGTTTTIVCPPELDSIRRAGIENMARRACESLGLCEGAARVDLMVSARDNEVILEVEPVPPLHRESIVARVARAAGLSYPRLCAQLFEVGSAQVTQVTQVAPELPTLLPANLPPRVQTEASPAYF